jgi:hypothetical protein
MIEMIDEVLPSWRWVFSLASRSGGGVACGVVPDTRWVVARLVFSARGFSGFANGADFAKLGNGMGCGWRQALRGMGVWVRFAAQGWVFSFQSRFFSREMGGV